MAFKCFADEKVDIAVIETGLGGRLDSTNVITPVLSIITNISYDHKDLLGQSLKEIASEKAGIIKHRVPVLIGEQLPETERVFFEVALHNLSTVYYAEALWDIVRVRQDARFQYLKAVHKAHREMYDLNTDLLGTYQLLNLKTVLAATEILVASQGLNLSLPRAIQALSGVKSLTGLRGRWDRLQEVPLVIGDVAHNVAGLTGVLAQWDQVEAPQKHIVLGVVRDKDVESVLSLFPEDTRFYFCQAAVPRALPVEELMDLASSLGLRGAAYASVPDAIRAAMDQMNPNDALLITGSFFIVGEAIDYFSQVTHNV